MKRKKSHQHCIDRSYGSRFFYCICAPQFQNMKKVNIRIFYVLRMPAKREIKRKKTSQIQSHDVKTDDGVHCATLKL